MARKVGNVTGKSPTSAEKAALGEKLRREHRRVADALLIDKLKAISDRCAARLVSGERRDEEIVGYDDCGFPV